MYRTEKRMEPMKLLQLADETRYATMSTEQLRASFLLDDLFIAGLVQLTYVDLDRTVVGSAVPVGEPLSLPFPAELRADSFTERRELGIFNIGSEGSVQIDDEVYAMNNRDALYVGRGTHSPARREKLSARHGFYHHAHR
jgi:4-deoxy-L-threo-5-hexosulose-uronate ketol-isomerase